MTKLHISIGTANTRLEAKKGLFLFSGKNMKRGISPARVQAILVYSNCDLTASAIRLAAKSHVQLYFFNALGSPEACVRSPYFKNIPELRIAQLKFHESTLADTYSIYLIQTKAKQQVLLLRQLLNKRPGLMMHFDPLFIRIESLILRMSEIEKQENRKKFKASLMGLEGTVSKSYWKAIAVFLSDVIQFSGRNKRPAEDPFNACLNYAYALLYVQVESSIVRKGLDTSLGVLHRMDYGRPALTFDLVEPFRSYIDDFVISKFYTASFIPAKFRFKQKACRIPKDYRKELVTEFKELMNKRVKRGGRISKLSVHIDREVQLYADKLMENNG